MAKAYVELPDGWGPARVVLVAWRNAGYDVVEYIDVGVGRYLEIR